MHEVYYKLCTFFTYRVTLLIKLQHFNYSFTNNLVVLTFNGVFGHGYVTTIVKELYNLELFISCVVLPNSCSYNRKLNKGN